MTRVALLPLLALLPLVASQPPAVPRTGEYLVTGVSHGVKLTLILPRKAYPHDAVVQVTIILKNLSHSQMWIEQLGIADEPKTEVLDTGRPSLVGRDTSTKGLPARKAYRPSCSATCTSGHRRRAGFSNLDVRLPWSGVWWQGG